MNESMEGMLKEAMRLELNRVLNEGEFNAERLSRVCMMAHGGHQLLAAAYPIEAQPTSPDAELEEKIRTERLLKLGFTPTMIEKMRAATERERASIAQSFKNMHAVFGQGDDDEEPEVEEVIVRQPDISRDIWVPVELVHRVAVMLVGTDSDTAAHLSDLLRSCGADVTRTPDAIVPVAPETIALIGVALEDPKTLERHPDAVKASQELAKWVDEAAAKHNQATLQQALESQPNVRASSEPNAFDGNDIKP